MMFNLFTCSVLLCTVLSSLVQARCLPCQVLERDESLIRKSAIWSPFATREVYSPNITSPTGSTTWAIGTEVTVTWDLHDMPKHITQPKGKIVLGYLKNGDDSEHLNINHPLAEGFDIRQGKVTFKAPKVEPGKDYIVVLFGDSGNRSDRFSID